MRSKNLQAFKATRIVPKFSHERWPSNANIKRATNPHYEFNILGHAVFAYRDLSLLWTADGIYSAPFFDLNPHRLPNQQSPYRTLQQLEDDTFEDRSTPQDYIINLYAGEGCDIYAFLNDLMPAQTMRILRFMLSHDALLRRLK